MNWAPSKDSDQPGHPHSLIRVFAVRMKRHWVLGTHTGRWHDTRPQACVAIEETFGYSNIRNDNSDEAHKPTWYGYQCRKIRRKWHSAKYVYKFNKNEVNKVALNRASKEHKKTMRQSYIKFKRFNIKKLKHMKSTNPKMYWKIINGGKQDAVQSSVENLEPVSRSCLWQN